MADCPHTRQAEALALGADLGSAAGQLCEHLESCEECRLAVARALGETAAPGSGPSSDAHGLPVPGALVGRYRILGRVGAGAMGVVFAAHDLELERRVALKFVRPSSEGGAVEEAARARLVREAQALARLSHPNVVAVFDAGSHGEQVFLAMEFVEGQTLREWLETPRRREEILDAFLAAGRGLAAAHAAGVVHRDFKPENVLMGKDGRVRVTDFGLARLDAANPVDGSSPQSASPFATAHGAVLGTPAYMPPEQRAGQIADERSDQFSFCAALEESLSGSAPGRLLEKMRSAAQGLRPPPAPRRIPGALRKALDRGLRAEPAERHGSMEALLAALVRHRRRSRVAWTAATAGLAIALGAAAARFLSASADPYCEHGSSALASSFTAEKQARIARRFAASGREGAPEAWERTRGALADWFRRWGAEHEALCAQPSDRLSEEIFLRRACLEGKLAEAAALVELLESADSEFVAGATAAVQELGSLRACREATASREPRLPEDPAVRARLRTVRVAIAGAKASLDAGRYREGIERLEPSLASARAIGFKPVEAEVLLCLGRLRWRLGALKDGERDLMDAALLAEASRHERVAAEAWVELVLVSGKLLNQPDRAQDFDRQASAAIARLGGDEELEAHRLHHLAQIHAARAEYDRAAQTHRAALELRVRIYSERHYLVAQSLSDLAMSLKKLGNFEGALSNQRRAIALFDELLGPEHPISSAQRNNLGLALAAAGRPLEALEVYQRARLEVTRALGPEHPALADLLNNIGVVLVEQRRYVEAQEPFERARAIREKSLGPDHPKLASAIGNLGYALLEQGKAAEALPLFERALSISERGLGEATVRNAPWLIGLGRSQASTGDWRTAVATLERAVSLQEGGRESAGEVGRGQAALAQVLWDHGERVRAKELAQKARAGFVEAGARYQSDLEQVDSLLARAGRRGH